jgi:hypothetical protein
MYHCSISHGCWTGVHSHNSPCLNHRAATKWNNWVNQEYNSNICIAVQKLSTPMSDYYSINLDKITYSRQILPCKSFLGDVRCTRFINHLMINLIGSIVDPLHLIFLFFPQPFVPPCSSSLGNSKTCAHQSKLWQMLKATNKIQSFILYLQYFLNLLI